MSPEQLAEVRRITLTNHGSQPRELELTSYVEPVLNYHGADLSHPAFGKLFLETEYLPGSDSLLCRRRPRCAHERPIWAVHVMAVDRSAPGCTIVGALQYETDRARFVGRGRTPADPAALGPNTILTGTIGPVLDPVFSLRRRFRVEPGGSAVVGFTLATAESRDSALALADAYHGISAVARAFELAWGAARWSTDIVMTCRKITCTSGWGRTCSLLVPPCGLTHRCSPPIARVKRLWLATASRATGQSSWRGSRKGPSFPS